MYKHSLPSKRSLLFIGTLTYIALGVLAFVFYKERTCFVDLSFHLFEIIRDGSVKIQNYRFGSVVTQWVPWLGAQMGLPLAAIAQLYSLAFVFYYFVVFLLALLVFKQRAWALVMLLMSTLMVSDTFYWVQSELPQGLAFLVLYFAFLNFKIQAANQGKLYLEVINIFMLITLAFFHPLLIFAFGFTVAYLYWNKTLPRFTIVLNFGLYFFFYLIKFFVFKTQYDGTAMGGLNNIFVFFPDYFSLDSNKNFLRYLIEDYYLLGLGFAAVVGNYIWSKQYWKASGLVLIFGGYLLLINISYPGDGVDQFYIENLYLPLALFVILPLIFELSTKLPPQLNVLVLSIALLIRVLHIGWIHEEYSERLDWKREIMAKTAKHEQTKVIIDKKIIPEAYQSMVWASAFEFWLLSTIEQGNTRSIVISEDPGKYNTPLWQFDLFLTEWIHYKYKDLPNQYFMLNDTSTYYRKVMTLEELNNTD